MLTPLVRSLALRFNVVDSPNARKIHTKVIPRLGGVAIFLGFIVALIVGHFTYTGIFTSQNIVMLSGGAIIIVLGMLDDIFTVKAPVKLLVEIFVACLVVFHGVRIDFIGNLFGGHINLGALGPFLSILWILALINTMNLIDGLDGLASGIAAISAVALFIISLILNQTNASPILIAIAGAALGFLRYNFNPASIFMGDTGSLFLGYILAVASIQSVLKSALLISLALPLLSLFIPILDTFLAIRRRLKKKVHIFKADAEHIHHKLIKRGYTHKQTVIVLYITSVLLNLMAIVLVFTKGFWSFLVFVLITIILIKGYNQFRKNIL